LPQGEPPPMVHLKKNIERETGENLAGFIST
jgi:hypothetical protein